MLLVDDVFTHEWLANLNRDTKVPGYEHLRVTEI